MHRSPKLIFVTIRIAWYGVVALFATHPARAEDINFARDVRPILSNNCFSCHGPDDQAREGELRLDMQAGVFGERGDNGVVRPGLPRTSELIIRVLSEDESEVMPPPESNKSLSDAEKQLLVAWVAQGAPWQQHWAFEAPRLPELPTPQAMDWCRTPLDQFVLSRLEGAGLTPAPAAEPYELVRRLYLDLIGLPPTPEEADRWTGRIWPDPNTGNAQPIEAEYQALVSYLLNSPDYGERWARRWLDLARYADTNGYEKDRDRSIWPYRDWVINALNADMPFDQFTVEQLAGDMLPDATTEQRIATGFHRNTMLNEEGGIDPLEFRYRAMTDRVATTGTTWLGLTLGCCQCHAHKYDPISHTEYFQLMAFLNNADEPQLELPQADHQAKWERNRAVASRLLDDLASQWMPPKDDLEREQSGEPNGCADDQQGSGTSDEERLAALQRAFEAWLESERENAVVWRELRPVRATANLPILTIQEDNSVFASGDTAKRDDYFVTFAASDQPITAIQLEALPDERLPARGPGSTYYEGTLGDFFLTEIQAEAAGKVIPFKSATESYAKNRYGSNAAASQLAIDGDVQTGWSVHGGQGERHVAVFVFQETLPAGAELQLHMTFGRHFASSLGRFRVRATASPTAPEAREYSDALAALLMKSEEHLTASERKQLLDLFLLSSPQLAAQAEKIHQLRQRPEVPHTLVMSERPPDHRRPTHRHHRGEFLQAREEVMPDTPEMLPPMPDGLTKDRLGFARWIVSPENPLTARVAVNRAWAAFFGTGLVRTVDDFGLQGESPSHPELLDWLALQFVHEYRWSLKRLHRVIVSSSTYRQSSKVNAAAARVDPNNRLLSFLPRFRLEAEIVRDSWLVASGKLSRKMGGPPVRPPQPEGVTEVAYGSPKWPISEGEDRFRRSIYTFAKRTAPFAMFATFDAPSGEDCVAQRARSNSPLQALTLLNDVMVIELARAAGDRIMQSDSTASSYEKSADLFRSVLTRPPTSDELDLLHSYFESQVTAFTEAPELARQLLDEKVVAEPATHDESGVRVPDALTLRAAWTATARAVFGLDEAQMRE